MGKKMGVDQFAELGSAVMRCLPRDMDTDVAQGWITNQAALNKALCEALCPPRSDNFVARDHFVVNTNLDVPVKISYLSDNFKAWFLNSEGKIEDPSSATSFHHFNLKKAMLDDAILKKLGGKDKAVVNLADVFALMAKQPNGQNGELLTDGYWNIFYVPDQRGILRAVYVRWRGRGWSVCAYSVEDPREWIAGDRAFSRNS